MRKRTILPLTLHCFLAAMALLAITTPARLFGSGQQAVMWS
jgi:hypothetical protein